MAAASDAAPAGSVSVLVLSNNKKARLTRHPLLEDKVIQRIPEHLLHHVGLPLPSPWNRLDGGAPGAVAMPKKAGAPAACTTMTRMAGLIVLATIHAPATPLPPPWTIMVSMSGCASRISSVWVAPHQVAGPRLIETKRSSLLFHVRQCRLHASKSAPMKDDLGTIAAHD